MKIKKILIVRFSSIGDIVLTTPVIRCLKNQLEKTEVHFVCKSVFAETILHNPYINKLYTFKKDIDEVIKELKSENYDLIIDLHYNLRSLLLKRKLGVKSFHFDKLNFKKFLAVNLKKINLLPKQHLVDRYFGAVETLGVKNDGLGLDYFIDKKDKVDIDDLLKNQINKQFIALVVGGSYFTKQIPLLKLNEICQYASLSIILLGGKSDEVIANEIAKYHKNVINACGKLTLNQSASLIQQAEWVITSDTGLMHIAAAFNKKIISVWGNTIPQFGMDPYQPNTENKILQVENLSCRPCSKLGYKKCPVEHFNCMNQIDFTFVKDLK